VYESDEGGEMSFGYSWSIIEVRVHPAFPNSLEGTSSGQKKTATAQEPSLS